MAVKVDQEFLLKNRFWIGLGFVVPLVLVSLLLLWISVAGAIETERKAVDDSKKALEGINNPKNQIWVDELHKIDESIAGKKNQVWAKAWRAQQNLMTWPAKLAPKYKDKYFGDPIDTYDRDFFTDKDTGYASQFYYELWDIVDPIDPRTGLGAVQFKDSWESVIQPVRDFPNLPLTSEDVWLAQEDLWVKRELLRVVRDANDSVGVFHVKPPPEDGQKKAEPAPDKAKLKVPPDEEIKAYKVFVSPYWEAEVVLTQKKDKHYIRGSLKNISSRRQPLGFYLLVRLMKGRDAQPVPVALDGEPLGTGDSMVFFYRAINEQKKEPSPVDRFNPVGIYGVEEDFNWRTVPVKRIDIVALGYSGHRIANRSLKPYPAFAPKTDAGAADATSPVPGAVPGSPPGGASDAPSGAPAGMGAFGAGGTQEASKSKNGLERYRYIDVAANGPVRRMPVAMVLIVDQNHIAEALAAFANSRLRIQTVQAHWQRAHENLEPPEQGSEVTSAQGGGDRPAMPSSMGSPGSMGRPGGSGKRLGGMGMGGGGMGMPAPPRGESGGGGDPRRRGYGSGGNYGGMPRMPGAPGSSFPGMRPDGLTGGTGEAEEEELSLVELSIYGIASLYERYPPRTPPAEAGDATKTEGQPAGAGAPAAAPTTPPAEGATPAAPPATGTPPAPAPTTPPTTPPASGAAPPAAPSTPPASGTPPAGDAPPAAAPGTPPPAQPGAPGTPK